MKPILRYIELNNGRCGLSIETPAKIMREQGTANVRGIRPATEADVVHVRSMGGDVPDGRIIAGQVGTAIVLVAVVVGLLGLKGLLK